MKFRPCIDLHNGTVKQIVGSTLFADSDPATNFISSHPPDWYAELYKRDGLTGGHIIKLGAGNDDAAKQALAVWPKGLQLGGGVTAENAAYWIEAGASHVIVTSSLFSDGEIDRRQVGGLVKAVGRKRLVFDLSCRRLGDQYYIVTDRWQTFTKTVINVELLDFLAESCAEFLVHAVDVEGKCSGVEEDLIELLGKITPIPTTYAGGIHTARDIACIREKGRGILDYTVGSSLDIFGGTGLSYTQLVSGEI